MDQNQPITTDRWNPLKIAYVSQEVNYLRVNDGGEKM